MLTVEDIHKLATENGLDFTAHYAETCVKGVEPPKPSRITVWFRQECVPAWEALMSQLTEVPVALYGTRQVTGSGATDGRLFPGYAQRVKDVNQARKAAGLAPVYG